jgi:hypothetical protein
MIFPVFVILMVCEAIIHSHYILQGIDPTPDQKRWGSIVAVLARFSYFGVMLFFIPTEWSYIGYFTFGCLFIHLLLFPIILNFLIYKPVDHLGKGFTDSLLAKVPPIARWFWLLCLASGMVYGYYVYA